MYIPEPERDVAGTIVQYEVLHVRAAEVTCRLFKLPLYCNVIVFSVAKVSIYSQG
jgi:hypothetical protein